MTCGLAGVAEAETGFKMIAPGKKEIVVVASKMLRRANPCDQVVINIPLIDDPDLKAVKFLSGNIPQISIFYIIFPRLWFFLAEVIQLVHSRFIIGVGSKPQTNDCDTHRPGAIDKLIPSVITSVRNHCVFIDSVLGL